MSANSLSDNAIAVERYLLALQDRVCAAVESSDGRARFVQDAWQRPEGGGRPHARAEEMAPCSSRPA
jgi:coproporphyrinogen III oxidase